MRIPLCWLLALASCGTANSHPIDPGADPKAILSAMRSNDPRAMAWGAWRALNVPDSSLHEELGTALLRLDPDNEAHAPAIHAVFHSIIDLKLALPSDTLYRYFERYPAATLIGLAHTKVDAGILSLLTSKTADDLYWTVIAEIACHSRIAGLARILLEGYVAEGFVNVTDDYDGPHWPGAGAPVIGAIQQTRRADADQWPPLFVYSLAAISGEPGDTLLITRPVPIYSRRLREGTFRSGGMPLDLRRVRHKLLRELVASFAESFLFKDGLADAISSQDMSSCPSYFSMSMTLRSPTEFVQRFAKLQQDRRKACDRMLDDLRKRGALSPDDNVTIPIRWFVFDRRLARGEAVPDLSKIGDVKQFGGRNAK